MRTVASSLGLRRSICPGWKAKTLVRGRHRGAFAFLQGLVPAAGLLAKRRLDESKHPRVPADRLKADGSNRAEAGRTPAMVTPLSKAVQQLGSQASMLACRLEDRQKFQRTSRLPISFAMSSQSWRQGGWRELWLALLLDLRESSLPLWMQRQKRPHGFTIISVY